MADVRLRAGTVELQVRDHGGDGEPLILLHYGGGNLMVWQQAIPYFQEGYRVITPDLRGHGKSDKPASGNDIDTMSSDILQIMDQLDLDRAHIVGSSLGAEVGLSLAAGHPDRLLSLVCEGAFHSEFGPYGMWEGTESEFKDFTDKQMKIAYNKPEPVFPSLDAFLKESRKVYQRYGWWNERVKAVEEYDAFKLPHGEYTSGWRKHSRLAYQKNYFEYRFEDYYSRVKSPVLMLPGEADMKNPRFREVLEGLRRLPEQAEVREVKGWIHPYGWLLNCDSMCRTVRGFFLEQLSE